MEECLIPFYKEDKKLSKQLNGAFHQVIERCDPHYQHFHTVKEIKVCKTLFDKQYG